MSVRARFALALDAFRLDVDLDLPGRGVTALFGPSGSGKTTLLRCVAGLERAPAGELSVDGEVWQDGRRFVPTHRRPLGYVFQEASLFPHLSVRGNLAYGMKRVSAAQRDGPLDAVVDLLGIGALLDRGVEHLSGGERQRVAIARALAMSPRLLLLDEPLASLDAARKHEILPYLERLHATLEIPVIYVSHSTEEVARLADHLVLLEAGRVVAQGALHETLARLDLASRFADEAGVVVEGVVGAHDDADHLSRIDFPGGSVHVLRSAAAIGDRVRLRVRAADLSISNERPTRTSILNSLAAVVTEIALSAVPGQVLVRLDAGGTPLVARITSRSCRELALVTGMPVWAQVKSVAVLR